uniref:uncharacterized protein LOC124050342 n=1 Tax=Scatophagus argus TaxID=75038 RepID=UPI001ED81846|nr:uncharacterized protein LOC124050342 [Scatophagus argus]
MLFSLGMSSIKGRSQVDKCHTMSTGGEHRMSLLELILICALQFEVCISGNPTRMYKRDGQEAILPCGMASPSDTTCSNFSWLYNRDTSKTLNVYVRGRIAKESSGRAARLSLGAGCSLVITNVTAEDAGLYTCRLGTTPDQDAPVFLSVLTISSSPPEAGQKRDGEVTLNCSLVRYSTLGPCKQDSIRWVNESGTLLHGEGVGHKFLGQKNCLSLLSVSQSGLSRKYTCQLLDEENKVLIDADYTPDGQKEQTNSDQTSITIIAAVVGAVVVLVVLVVVVIAAVLIKYRQRAKVTEDVQKPSQQPSCHVVCTQDEPESNLTYITISHANQQASSRQKIRKAEEVTYSTVKTPDKDPSSLYSSVGWPK